jgi:hypothetical protein
MLILTKTSKTIELISKQDDAVLVDEQGNKTIIDGKEPTVFVFKNPKLIDINFEYTSLLLKLRDVYGIKDKNSDLTTEIEKLSDGEKLKLSKSVLDIQIDIIKLLLIGYKQGETLTTLDDKEKSSLIEDLIQNGVIVEFITEIQKKQTETVEKKS